MTGFTFLIHIPFSSSRAILFYIPTPKRQGSLSVCLPPYRSWAIVWKSGFYRDLCLLHGLRIGLVSLL